MSAIPSPISPGPRVGGRGGSRSLDLLERRADQLLFGLRALGSPELLRSPPSRSPAVQVSIMLPAFPGEEQHLTNQDLSHSGGL